MALSVAENGIDVYKREISVSDVELFNIIKIIKQNHENFFLKN